MQAIILCGGKGTRLSALYPDVPKILAPIAGKPFLPLMADWLGKLGVHDIHFAAGHLSAVLERWLAENPLHGFTHSSSQEPTPLGTGGGLKFVEPWIRSDPFIVLNGDSLMPNLDFQSLEKAHAGCSNRWITIAVCPIEQAGRYGTVEFESSGKITAFREKAAHAAGWINGGLYMVNREALTAIKAGTNLSMETDIFPALVAQSRASAFRTAPPMLDMGTPEGIQAMEAWIHR